MLQGTGSDVGKSLLAAGLCRYFTRLGYRVRPFKPQNMSNNAAITSDGGEIGRAQALQAIACRAEPTADMNPVLLKPEGSNGSQVIIQGRAQSVMRADDYWNYRRTLMPMVLESFGRLCGEADIVIAEGAGSCSEVNLRHGDIANMGFAIAAGVPVVLVADIDRGGIIASIVGACALSNDEERALLRGCVINKFRGDRKIFEPALDIIRSHTGLRCFGVMGWFDEASRLPAEDSLGIPRGGLLASLASSASDGGGRKIRICVLALARISNFDDFDPLAAESDVSLSFVKPGEAIPGDVDLVILPGTKSTIADLEFIRHQGWDVDILAHVRRGGWVLGICGGFQILGREVADPEAIESPKPVVMPGLGLLDVSTVMAPAKVLRRFVSKTLDGTEVRGYEIHAGRTYGPGMERPMMLLDGVPEGSVSPDGKILGCYIHGLFTSDGYRSQFLSAFRGGEAGMGLNYGAEIDRVLDALADRVGIELDMKALAETAGLTEFH
jgi:adenosylcobyric acid synthase